MYINWDSILGKYNAFIKSDAGKQKIKEAMINAPSVSTNIMEEAGQKMAEVIKECAIRKLAAAYGNSSLIPSSINELLTSDIGITTAPYKNGTDEEGNDTFGLDVGFSDENELYRPSLRWRKKQSPYKGIDNIISLFDTGYYSRNRAYGYTRTGAYTVTKTHLFDELGFMSEAVDTFNEKYGATYGCQAYISADPKFYAR